MEQDITNYFNQNTSYTLNNGIAMGGGTNFVIRITYSLPFIRFSSNVNGVVVSLKLKKDPNPNVDFYNIFIPQNNTGNPILLKIYGYYLSANNDQGVLLVNAYQAG